MAIIVILVLAVATSVCQKVSIGHRCGPILCSIVY